MLYRLHTGRAYEAIERLATEGGSKKSDCRGASAPFCTTNRSQPIASGASMAAMRLAEWRRRRSALCALGPSPQSRGGAGSASPAGLPARPEPRRGRRPRGLSASASSTTRTSSSASLLRSTGERSRCRVVVEGVPLEAQKRRRARLEDGVAVFVHDLKFGRRKVAPEVALAADEQERHDSAPLAVVVGDEASDPAGRPKPGAFTHVPGRKDRRSIAHASPSGVHLRVGAPRSACRPRR
jgi:hypothetical protein